MSARILLAAVVAAGAAASAHAFPAPGERPSIASALVRVQIDRAALQRLQDAHKAVEAARKALAAAKKSGGDVEAATKALEAAEADYAAAREPFDKAKRGGGEGKDKKDDAEKAAADAKARAEAKAKAEADAKAKREAEAKAKAEALRKRMAEEAAKRKAEADAKAKAEADAKTKTQSDDDATKKADVKEDDERKRRFGDRDDDQDRKREERKTSAKELAKTKVEEGASITIDAGDRVIRREGGKLIIESGDRDRFTRGKDEERVERLDGGRTRIIIRRPDGSELITVRDSDGDIIRRVRRERNGREIVLINNDRDDDWRDRDDRDRHRDDDRWRDGRDRGDWDRRHGRHDHTVSINLGPLRINIPRDEYIVDARRASRSDIEEALIAPPVEPVERQYSLEEIRRYDRIRDKMRRIDLTTITFDTDSAMIGYDQLEALERLGRIIGDIIARRPDQVFLIEGHTDLVGSEIYNLALSDRRAESVAIALTQHFDIPPENLVTQGYGESYPKIPTYADERENRRVAVRNISPLLAGH